MAGVLLTVNGKLITNPKTDKEYGFYVDSDDDVNDIRDVGGREIIQGVSANQLYSEGVRTLRIVAPTTEGDFSLVINSNGNYYFHDTTSGDRGTFIFDVKYGKYAGYTVVGEDVFPRSLLTA